MIPTEMDDPKPGSIAFIIYSLQNFLRMLMSNMSWQVGLAILLMVSVSLTEGIGLLLIIPMLYVAGMDVGYGAVGEISQFFASLFKAFDIDPTLTTVLILFVLILSLHEILFRWRTVVMGRVQIGFANIIQKRLYKSVAQVDWLFFVRTHTSKFSHSLLDGIVKINYMTQHFLSFISNFIVALIYILLAIKLSFSMTLVVCACGLILGLFSLRRIQKARDLGTKTYHNYQSLYARTIDHLSGMKLIKSHSNEMESIKMYSGLSDRVKNTLLDEVEHRADLERFIKIGAVISLAIILYVALEIMNIYTTAIIFLLLLFARVLPKMIHFSIDFYQFINLLPSFSMVMDLMGRCEKERRDDSFTQSDIHLKDKIEFSNISFDYEPDKTLVPLIDRFNLSIKAGQMVALVGPSGVGKTTIADILMGLLDPLQGSLLIDGQPLGKDQWHSWKNQIGYVAQDPFLFNDTIRENLKWGNPQATDEDMREALKMAVCDDFVKSLPLEMETVVGDRGARLSGGENQRLTLARAILRKPLVLVLDEATSSLDAHNEKTIRDAIDGLKRKRTVFIVTHRLSTIRNADVIHVMERGKIVESGSWDTLIRKEKGRIRELLMAQGFDQNL